VGEIDRRLGVGGETEKREIGAARKTSGGVAQLNVLGGGEASSWRPIYRRWKAVERGGAGGRPASFSAAINGTRCRGAAARAARRLRDDGTGRARAQ